MGNDHSGHDLPTAYYSPEYGVAIGGTYIQSGHGRNRHCVGEDQLRNRKYLDSKEVNHIESVSDSVCIAKTSRSSVNGNVITENPNETDESGFHDLDAVFDPDISEEVSVSPSLKANYSPKSLSERNSRFLIQRQSDFQTDNAKNRSDLSLASFEGLDASSVLLTPPSEDDLSPLHSHSLYSNFAPDKSGNSCLSEISFSDVSRQRNESLTSPSESLGEWSLDEDESGSFSPVSGLRSPDRASRQSLIRQLRERVTSPGKSVVPRDLPLEKKSPYHYQSIDSLGCFSGTSTPDFSDKELFEEGDIFIDCEFNFSKIENELENIHSEVDVLTSRLDELKNLAVVPELDGNYISSFSTSSPLLSQRLNDIVRKAKHINDRPSSGMMSDRSSRSNSLLDAWDMCGMDTPDGGADNDCLYVDTVGDYAVISVNPRQCLPEDKCTAPVTTGNTTDTSNSNPPSSEQMHNSKESHDHSEQINDSLGQTNDPVVLSQDILQHSHDISELGDAAQASQNKCDAKSIDGTTDMTVHILSSEPEESPEDCDTETDGDNQENIHALPCKTDFRSVADFRKPSNIGRKWNIMEYAAKEWRGDTRKARLMRQGYREIPDHLKCEFLYQIRGDNYCGIRSTLFQILANGLPLLKHWSPLSDVLQTLEKLFEDQTSGLSLWTFGTRLSVGDDTALSVMAKCISRVYSKVQAAVNFSSYDERVRWTMELFNTEPDSDIQLMEGVKLLMLLNAVHLRNQSMEGLDVPVFVWLMFARDTSETPRSLVKNHLNPVGGTAGLEQVEMFLLGHTLKVTIQVVRLQQYGEEDFITYYPDEISDCWPSVSLIAEDDRHYNVPVS